MTASVVANDLTLTTSDNFTLHTRTWTVADPKGVILMNHGVAEHSGRYEHIAQSFCEWGYSAAAYDLRGHGRSSGKRNYVNSFQDYLDDLKLLLNHTRQGFPNLPVFLFGHSMGGGIVTLFTIEREPDIRGIILSAPSVKVSDEISPLLQKISGVLSVIAPKLPAVKLESKDISRDPKVVEAYDSDPLNYRGGILARTGAELLSATQKISANCSDISLPILIMHGTGDKLADVSGSQMLYDTVSSSDKTLKLYEGLYHEILNEPEQDQVKADLRDWLDAHV